MSWLSLCVKSEDIVGNLAEKGAVGGQGCLGLIGQFVKVTGSH